MHAEDKIGLRLDYWVDRRIVAAKDPAKSSLSTESSASTVPTTGSLERPYNLLIDCEELNATQYPSIRISNAWLADTAAESLKDDILPLWQDPPPTFIPNTETSAGTGGSLDLGITRGTLPNIRFVARLDPPVTLSLSAAIEIFNHVGQPIPHESIQPTTFAALLFPAAVQESSSAKDSSKDAELHFDRVARSFDASGKPTSHRLRFNFFSQPDSWARTIHEIPFSHPKQLVDILPYLRQWAFFGKMLQRSFGVDGEQSLRPETGRHATATTTTATDTHPTSNRPIPNRTRPPQPKKPNLNFRIHHYQPYDPPSDTDSSDSDNEPNKPAPARRAIEPPKPPLSSSAEPTTHHSHSILATPVSIDVSFAYAPLPRRIDLALSISFPSSSSSSSFSPSPRTSTLDLTSALTSSSAVSASPTRAPGTAPASCLATFRVQPNAGVDIEHDVPYPSSSVSFSIIDAQAAGGGGGADGGGGGDGEEKGK
ncbi:MAG: hypothetical protein LQ340_008034, partial [Diploschistes diacapsis]